MAEKLTEPMLKNLAAPTDGRGQIIVYDSVARGLGLRITRSNSRSWVLTYRNRMGREHRYTIGRFADWPLPAARKEAGRLRRIIDAGGDPLEKIAFDRAAATVADLTSRFLRDYAPRLRTTSRRAANDAIEKWIKPELGKALVSDVRHGDIQDLHRKITNQGTPYTANRVISLVTRLFNLAIKWELTSSNPAVGIERNPEQKRTRYLSPTEIARVADALTKQRAVASANAIRLLMLTGARRGEVLGARWDAIDLERGIWIKPGATTKQKTEHRVPLSTPAIALLREIRAGAELCARRKESHVSEFVFPGGDGKPLGNIKNTWRTVCKAAGLGHQAEKRTRKGAIVRLPDGNATMTWENDVRIHDLRHTYASILASAGLSLPIIGQLLGHTQTATTARYAHLMDDPLREATERVARAVQVFEGVR